MRTSPRIVIALAIALVLSLSVSAVASGHSPWQSRGDHHRRHWPFPGRHKPPRHGREKDTISVLSTVETETLDPSVAFTAQAFEATWLTYTPLLTYSHVQGPEGATLIPGLATALPKVSADGRTYELTLRKNLTYSDGTAVKARDFAYAIMRGSKMWEGSTFYTDNIVGAKAYANGEASSISGITTDDKTGKITITLINPLGAFGNVLAFPSSAPIPWGTPMTDLAADPPPGVGPYEVFKVDGEGGYTLKKNARFACLKIPGIPVGYAEKIKVSLDEDSANAVEQVLNNEADVFDNAEEIPAELLPRIFGEADDRYQALSGASTFYFFLNTTKAPFNNLKARQAVETAIDRQKLVELTGGFMKPSCYLLPEGVPGHPTAPCPYGETPDIAKAQKLVQESGMAGTPVTVWTQERLPRREYADYYTDMLNKIGFDATEKVVGNSGYFSEIGDETTGAQTGFADWFQDYPNPSDFYFVLDGRTLSPEGTYNFSRVNDPFIQEQLISLNEVPASQIGSVADKWQALDTYVANQAYMVPFGQKQLIKLYSDRIDFGKAVFHVLYGNDFSTMQLKK